MDQTNIIQLATQEFADKLKPLGEVRIQDHHENGKQEGQSLIQITFLCIEEVVIKNMMERIKCQGRDDENNLIEYFVTTPSTLRLTFMVTPFFKTWSDTMKILGEIILALKDDNRIPVDKYDWVDNKGSPILIMPAPDMDMKRQMEVSDFLKMDYRPSLFYQLVVGINSEKKDIFKRVKERKITADYLESVRSRAGGKLDGH